MNVFILDLDKLQVELVNIVPTATPKEVIPGDANNNIRIKVANSVSQWTYSFSLSYTLKYGWKSIAIDTEKKISSATLLF